MVIDVHVHLFESVKYISSRWLESMERYYLSLSGPEGYQRFLESFKSDSVGSADTLVADMDSAGVDLAVCFPSGPFHPFPDQKFSDEEVWTSNQYIAEAQNKYPNRIAGFVRPDPLKKSSPQLIEEAIVDWGLKGVKLHPVVYPMTDEMFRPLLDKIYELRVPVLLHQGVDPIPFLARNGNPEAVDELTARYPEMRILAPHTALGYEDLLTAVITMREDRVFTDLALLQNEYVQSPWHFLCRLRYLMDMAPHSVVMGSDWPWTVGQPLGYKEWFDAIRDLTVPTPVLELGLGYKQFSVEEKSWILGDNGSHFLGVGAVL